MAKLKIASVLLYSKRADIRSVVRQAFKSHGLTSEQQQNVMNESDMLQQIQEQEYAFLVLDWEMGADSVQRILEANRRENKLESHPSFLLAAKEQVEILELAREYHISYLAIGEVNTDTIREQTTGLYRDYQNLSPVRQVLINVHHAWKQNEFDKAHTLLLQLYEKSPENPRVVVELAESYIERQEWDAAEALLRPHIDQKPPSARIKHLYARCRLKKKDYNGAIASLKGAQLISPYNLERLLEMGELFLDFDRLDEAMEAYSDILEFAPMAKKARFGKSQALMLAGEMNEALGLLRECANNQELSAIFNTAAIIAIRQEKQDLGFRLYLKALQILRQEKKLSSRVVYNLGIGMVKAGYIDKGLICFEKSFELDPAFDNASYNIKVLRQHLKQPQKKNTPVPIHDAEADLEQDILKSMDEAVATEPTDFTEEDAAVQDDLGLDQLLTELGNL
ncbi:MAG: tetratricopeptide repeat protein [Oligoflexus sp.]